mgnify:CR=1 FL=1
MISLLIADAFGLALFTISGAQVAEARDLPGLHHQTSGAANERQLQQGIDDGHDEAPPSATRGSGAAFRA